MSQIEFLPGPLTSELSRTAAEAAIQKHPAIRKGAAYALEQLDGRWVAAVVHEAGPFGGPPGGGPADATEEAPGPKSEGPDDTEPSAAPEPEGADGDSDDGGESGPPKEKSESDKGGKGEIHQVLDVLQQIAEALGVPLGLGESPVPGAEGPSGPPPGPAGPAGPPGPPSLHGGPSEQHVIHERVTKPGETPPGGTPIGAPAFASVRADHPWAHVAGKVASFEVVEKIGNAPLPKIEQELSALSSEIGYNWRNLREATDVDGDRVAVAVITKH